MSNAMKVENTRNQRTGTFAIARGNDPVDKSCAEAFAIARGNDPDNETCAGEHLPSQLRIARGNGPVTTKYAKTNANAWPISADIAEDAVNGSAVNENLKSSFLRSGLNFMHGERRGIQVNQQKTNQTKIGDEPSATEVGALENDVDAIALKLGKMLKMLDTMLAAEKKYHKSDFNSWTVRDLRASQPESRMDRQLPLKEEQGLQRRPTFTANCRDNILGPKRPQGPQPTGEKTGAATSTSRRRLGRANSHGDSSDTHNQYQYLASEQVQILPDAIKERDQQYAETATAQKQSKKANYAATSRGSRSSQTLDEDNDSDTEIPVYFSSLARICARKQCSQATDEDNESDTEIPVYFSSLARIRVCRPTADLQDATTPTTGYQETTELELSLRESDQDRTSTFGECPTTSSTQPSAEATKSECIPRATKVSEDGATFIHGEQPTTPSGPEAIRMEGECIPGPAAVSDDSASTTNVYPSTDEPTFVVTSSRDEDLIKTI